MMRARKAKSLMALEQHAVWIEFEGRRVTGTYMAWNGVVTVTSGAGIKQAELGRLPPDVLARLLLRELVADGKGAAH